MLLTITSKTPPATDIGFVLRKNPANVRTVELSFGTAYVFYPEATDERCTACLLVEVDPIGLVRRGRGRPAFSLADYVNDRPYAASSFMSTAIAKVFGTAMSGGDDDEHATRPMSLEAHLPVVPCRGGEELVRELFEPLGYGVAATTIPLDTTVPAWGDSRCLDVTLAGDMLVRDLLRHLFVLLPVMDDDKHYWVERAEIEKLLAKGESWLGEHPRKELITRRYLRYRVPLLREALQRLSEGMPDEAREPEDRDEAELERQVSLAEQRIGAVLAVLRASGATSVLDLGCGNGKLLSALLREGAFERIGGADVSIGALEAAERRLHVDEMSPRQRERLSLFQSAVTYRDDRLRDYDAIVLMEVIEHVDAERLPAVERTVLGDARPRVCVVTTPNVEFNTRFDGLPEGSFRHRDHRFEWTRREFEAWAAAAASRHDYRVRFLPVGPADAALGSPTQMAVFER